MNNNEIAAIIPMVKGYSAQRDFVVDGGVRIPVVRLTITLHSTQITKSEQLQPLVEAFTRFLASKNLSARSGARGFLQEPGNPDSIEEPRVLFTVIASQLSKLQEALKTIGVSEESEE